MPTSTELVFYLNRKNVHFLYQASQVSTQGLICSNWLDNSDLGLESDLAAEWERYRRNLIGSGIHLTARLDELKWTGGDSSSHLRVKNVYNTLSSKLWKNNIDGWRKKPWSWNCPQKINLFAWRVIENKILTWKNLQKRGWMRPGIFHLCKGKRESGKHFFVNCPFTISVWERIKMAFNFSIGWSGSTVTE
jgi:hypothetical protein